MIDRGGHDRRSVPDVGTLALRRVSLWLAMLEYNAVKVFQALRESPGRLCEVIVLPRRLWQHVLHHDAVIVVRGLMLTEQCVVDRINLCETLVYDSQMSPIRGGRLGKRSEILQDGSVKLR